MSETQIQDLLARTLLDRDHRLIVPNVFLWGRSWESDLVSVTASGYLIEFEIKRSVSDFRRDREKKRHGKLKRAYEDDAALRVARGNGPTRFIYVLGDAVSQDEIDVPGHAGVVSRSNVPNMTLSAPPRLHRSKVSKEAEEYLARGLMWRYWKAR